MKRSGTAWVFAAALLLSGCATFQGTPAAVPPASTVPPGADATPTDCARLPAKGDEAASLEPGIARITLCNDPGHAARYGLPPGPTPPPDALVRGTRAVVEAYNALEVAHRETMACTSDLGPAFRLVVQYADGRAVQLSGELFGCRIVGNRMGAPRVLEAFTEALLAQREELSPPTRTIGADEACRSTSSWVTPQLEDTTRGVLCTGFDASARGREITAADWRVVLADIAANARPAASEDFPSTCAQDGPSTLVAVSPAGEVRSLQRTCDFYTWQAGDGPRPFDDQVMGWTPGERAGEILG